MFRKSICKKATALVLAGVLAMSALTACGSNDNGSESASGAAVTSDTKESDTSVSETVDNSSDTGENESTVEDEKSRDQEIIESLAVGYASAGDDYNDKIDELSGELTELDADKAARWNSIMELWKNIDETLVINYDVLPDGLPETNELCIIVLGFQLNEDGTMKDELIERLKVAKASAEKYPESYVVCTGGGTAKNNESATEAGEMAKWLIENGISEDRVIVEDKSITTAQNAIYTFEILADKYPEVNSLAIVSSDYHIRTGWLLFTAEATLLAEKAGEEKIKVISDAAWKAPGGFLSDMFNAGALIELSGDIKTAFEIYYDNYDIHDLPDVADIDK